MFIDLNADLGEGGPDDAALMPLLSSASVCCGLHAGGPDATAEAIELAVRHGVRVGAHPGYHDPAAFGRAALDLPDDGVGQLVYQLGALDALARLFDARVAYLKLHGAMYHRAAADAGFAELVVSAAARFGLPLLGPPGGALRAAAADADVPYFAEGFLDRGYRADGTLVPRGAPGAVLADPAAAAAQAVRLAAGGTVASLGVHGDTPGAVELLRAARAALEAAGYAVRGFGAGA